MIAIQFATFWCAVILCFVAAVRLKRTPSAHPDLGARRDMARLLGVVAGGLGMSVARTQFLPTSLPFIALSVLLLLPGVLALWLIVRLLHQYRRERVVPADPTLPDVETLQSRFSPPSDGPKR